MKHGKKSLAILFSVIVLDLIGFGVVIPILPFYAEAYGASATVLGLLLTSYALMQFVFSPVWGRVSDKWGRKKVLLFTMAGSAVGLFILGMAHSLLFLFIGRIVSGIFGANISIATAYVTDVTTEKDRAKGMGLIGAAFGIGFILGPAIGGILSVYGYSVPVLAASGLAALNVFYAYFRLGESHHAPSAQPASRLALLKNRPILLMVCINFFYTFGITQLEATFAFFMMDRFHYDAKGVAYILVLMAFIMVLVQGGLIRRLVPAFGEKKLFLFGALLLAGSFYFVPGSPTVLILVIPLSVSALGRGVSQPSILSMVSKYAPGELRGGVMGVFQSAASLARVLGPAIAGLLYDRYLALPYFFAAGVLGMVFLISLVLIPNDRAISI